MDWINGIATVALAVVAALAYKQNRDLVSSNADLVDTAREQAELTRETLARQLVAILVPAGPDACRQGDLIETRAGTQVFRTKRIFIGIENAGPGLARLTAAEAASRDGGTFNVWWPPMIPAGAQRDLQLTPGGGKVELVAGETIRLEVEYEGQDGAVGELRFSAQHYPGGDWLVQSPPPET